MVAADPGYHSQVDIWFEVKKFSFSLEIFVSFNRASHDLGRTSKSVGTAIAASVAAFKGPDLQSNLQSGGDLFWYKNVPSAQR